MKLAEFTNVGVYWDEYRAFHKESSHYNYVQFQTGELMVTSKAPSPVARDREINGMRFMYTYPQACPTTTKFYTPDGEELPKAWLRHAEYGRTINSIVNKTYGGQYLLVDMDTRKAVGLSFSTIRSMNLPDNLRRGAGLFMGDKREPIGAPVRYAPPYKTTAEERKWMADVLAIVKAVVNMEYEGRTAWVHYTTPLLVDMQKDLVAYPDPAAYVAEVRKYENILAQVYKCGLKPLRREVQVSHVLVRWE